MTRAGEARRERLRRQTIDEIEHAAFALLDDGGIAAVSLAAVGKAVDMTAPALYRYFASREALVAALVAAAYADLGGAVAAAARDAEGGADARVAAIAHRYRDWAVAHPRRYMLLFTDRSPNAVDPPDGVTRFNEAMLALLEALVDLSPTEAEPAPTAGSDDDVLAASLHRWRAAIGGPADASPVALRLGVLLWSRVHGLVTLEILGSFDTMGVGVELLLEAEVRAVLEAVARQA
jgi:AcrR family transcriptional regulator